VFVFSEGVLMGDDQILRYEEVMALRPRWRQVLDGTGVDYVVVSRGCPLDDVLAGAPGWRLAYADPTAVVYLRSAPKARTGGPHPAKPSVLADG
jgi:hypothetical protein